jgi:hypothetical protein
VSFRKGHFYHLVPGYDSISVTARSPSSPGPERSRNQGNVRVADTSQTISWRPRGLDLFHRRLRGSKGSGSATIESLLALLMDVGRPSGDSLQQGPMDRVVRGRLQILRPHLTGRVLGTMSNAAWHSRGARGESATLCLPRQLGSARTARRILLCAVHSHAHEALLIPG